ncbi:hypothetical protein MMC10_003866 [Thelotrema lepadinum]|nr:hypothetical protein [Thelotrema lepadinum]
MARFIFLFFNLLAFVRGQGSVLPQSTAPANPTCGGCYVIADVAGVVFGNEVVQTATNVVSVGTGKNGTQITTSFVQQGGEFSFNPSGLITGSPGEVAFATGTVITVGGATLTSPTAYNVFTGYRITSIIPSGGQCITSALPSSSVSPAFSVTIPANPGPEFIFEAEQSFIDHVGGVTCAAAGASISMTTQIPIGQTTVALTTSGPIRPTPVSQPSVASSTSAASAIAETQSTSASTSTASPTVTPTTTVLSTVSLTNNSTGTIIVAGNATSILTGSGPSATFVPFLGAANAVFAPSALVTAVAMLVPGVFALLL